MSTHSQALSNRQIESKRTPAHSKGLLIEEPLIFEKDQGEVAGVDWDDVQINGDYLNGQERNEGLGLPRLSEPEVVRHYTRLSQKNYGIDTGLYPLGSCTMKHNPRLNERVARYFGNFHPLQPSQSVQGSLEVMWHLSQWLIELTGMDSVALSPAAGAQGELCGMMVIKKALKSKGQDHKNVVLVPESAHGTNPATASLCGFQVKTIKADNHGQLDLADLQSKIDDHTAAIMLTNPNTCGLFEKNIIKAAELIHQAGGYFYCDGANFNAIVGKVKVQELGVDCMHINLHKTFSTPHGGGGPGSGPVVFAKQLTPYLPSPYILKKDDIFIIHEEGKEDSVGRLKAYFGQMGMFTRALAYMMSHGKDGLRQVAEDAVLNANYLYHSLKDVMTPAFDGPFMHEILFTDEFLKPYQVSTLDFAKALIDKGYHPMTMYFPLVVSGALLIEPTETETKETLDQFVGAIKEVIEDLKAGKLQAVKEAPFHTPRRRLDETQAARQPKLKWTKQST